MKADTKTEAAVMAVMNQFIESFNKRDLNRITVLFAPDPDVVFYGTGADEKVFGPAGVKADLERAFKQSEASSIELVWSSISTAGSVAWIAADCVILAKIRGQEISFPVRITSVVEKRGNRWLIVQSHASVPAAGQQVGESWPVA